MRIAVLASGSSGNATVVEAGGTRVLIDCGISLRQIKSRMAAVGMHEVRFDAVLVTHEHSDHVRGLDVLRRRAPAPVLATRGTAEAVGDELELAQALSADTELRLGEMRITPVATSHDAAEPVGFVIEHRGRRAAIVTDTGVFPGPLLERLGGCHALLLEANHDLDMLRFGSYPWTLKQRIASQTGHLSNDQSRAALERLCHSGLGVVVGMHRSLENNQPALVLRELGRPLDGSGVRLELAHQDRPLLVDVAEPARQVGQLGLFDGWEATARGGAPRTQG